MFDAHALDFRDASDAAAWDDLQVRAPWRTPFSDRAFAAALAGAFGLGLEAVGVREGGRLVAGTLLFAKRRGPLRLAVAPPLAAYHGPLADPLPREANTLARRSALDALLADVVGRFHACTFHPPPALADARPFAWAGFGCAPLYTYTLRTPEAATRAGWSEGARRAFRTHADAYTWREGPSETTHAVRLIAASQARKGRRAPLPDAPLVALVDALVQAGVARVVTVGRGETREAAVALPVGDGVAYYGLAGSVPGPAMTVLLGRLFERLAAEGVGTFDFVGANTPSVATFKRHFGGALVPYLRAVSVRGRALQALHAVRPLA